MRKVYLKQLFVTLAMLLCCVTASAHDFEVDGIFYEILSRTDKTVAVTYKGNFHDSYFNEYSYAVAIPANVTYNGTTYSVTTIGYGAFSSCNNLISVTIPNSVITIERSAFSGCASLANVTIPKSVTYIRSSAFEDCSNLANIIIPNSVTDIGDWAFYNCTSLVNVTIGNSVTYIGFYAFSNCKNLKSVIIPNSVANVGYNAFSYCTNLTSVTIGSGVTTIGNNAFYYCTNLTDVTIPNSVTYVGECAFFNCTSLESVTIPNSVTTIGNYAFENCSSLKEVHITDIAAWCNIDFGNSYSNPLYYAKNLYLNGELVTDLIIPEGLTEIKKSAFVGCKSITSITIPNGVTSIEDRTFNSCSNLKSVEMPNSVTIIGSYAFYGCSGLMDVTIPNNVTTIGSGAFSCCYNLTGITIGREVNNIDVDAFAFCDNLTDVYCLATKVPETDASAFYYSQLEYMALHVPAEAIDNYKTTVPWNSFGTIEAIATSVCAIPQISYSNGKLLIDCETEGAEFFTTVTSSYVKDYATSEFDLAAIYEISVYATAAGHDNSEIVNATLCWIENGDGEGAATGIISIPATAALITSSNGTVTVSCSLDGEAVAVYATDGVFVGAATIENGSVTIATGLSEGTIAIVKIGEKCVKIII